MMAAANRADPLPDLQVFDKDVLISTYMTGLARGIKSRNFDDIGSILCSLILQKSVKLRP